MQIYDQHQIILKLNSYLCQLNRKLKLNYGYCHGLTLLWLWKISQQQEKWFYDTIKLIVNCDKNVQENIQIEKFLASMEWLQNSNSYQFNIQQLDVDKALELTREFSFGFLFDPTQISQLLEKIIEANKLICLSGTKHTIGIFKRNQLFYLYDSNYLSGRPKYFTLSYDLAKEAIKCLYPHSKFHHTKIPIQINILSEHSQELSSLKWCDQLINKNTNVNEKGFQGLSYLYVACENRNEELVKALIKEGADVNLTSHEDGWTPLMLVAQKGYTSLAEILISQGANPNVSDKEGNTPLYLAAHLGQIELVLLLLKSGANLQLKACKSPLALAVTKLDWIMVITLLAHANLDALSEEDNHYIIKYKKKLLSTAKQVWNSCEVFQFKKQLETLTSTKKQKFSFFKMRKSHSKKMINDSEFLKPKLK